MKCKAMIAGAGLLLASSAIAGVAGPTAHSRANCFGFNESITWWLGYNNWWRVHSFHYRHLTDNYPDHTINTFQQYSWRVAAYHSTEAYSSRGDAWYVVGYHFWYPNGKERLDVVTSATNCNIYDGWWDY